jgi:hypothetical protein
VVQGQSTPATIAADMQPQRITERLTTHLTPQQRMAVANMAANITSRKC